MRPQQLTNLVPLVTLQRPFQVPVPAFVPSASYVGAGESKADRNFSLDTITRLGVESLQAEKAAPPIPAANERKKMMDLTLKGTSRNGKRAIYGGAANTFHIPVSAFPNRTPPQTISVADGTFEPAKVKQPKVKMTPEERAAARAAKPKPTLAERIAKREAQLAKDKKRLAAEGNQPSM